MPPCTIQLETLSGPGGACGAVTSTGSGSREAQSPGGRRVDASVLDPCSQLSLPQPAEARERAVVASPGGRQHADDCPGSSVAGATGRPGAQRPAPIACVPARRGAPTRPHSRGASHRREPPCSTGQQTASRRRVPGGGEAPQRTQSSIGPAHCRRPPRFAQERSRRLERWGGVAAPAPPRGPPPPVGAREAGWPRQPRAAGPGSPGAGARHSRSRPARGRRRGARLTGRHPVAPAAHNPHVCGPCTGGRRNSTPLRKPLFVICDS